MLGPTHAPAGPVLVLETWPVVLEPLTLLTVTVLPVTALPPIPVAEAPPVEVVPPVSNRPRSISSVHAPSVAGRRSSVVVRKFMLRDPKDIPERG